MLNGRRVGVEGIALRYAGDETESSFTTGAISRSPGTLVSHMGTRRRNLQFAQIAGAAILPRV